MGAVFENNFGSEKLELGYVWDWVNQRKYMIELILKKIAKSNICPFD